MSPLFRVRRGNADVVVHMRPIAMNEPDQLDRMGKPPFSVRSLCDQGVPQYALANDWNAQILPAARPFASTRSAIFNDAASIRSPLSETAPRASPPSACR